MAPTLGSVALFLFDTEIVLAGETLPDNKELSLALGFKTLVHWTSTQSLTYIGLSLSGGTPVNGQVVCFSNENNSSFQQTFAHESVLEATFAYRFRNAGLTAVAGGTGAGAIWYRYNSTLAGSGRWVMIGKTA